MNREAKECGMCGGLLPMQEVWESMRDAASDCRGSVDDNGRCHSYGKDVWKVHNMAMMLSEYDQRFTGNNISDEAEGWIDEGFTPESARKWVDIGMWDASVAAKFRDAEFTPDQVAEAASKLVAAEDEVWDEIDENAAESDEDWSPCDRDSKYTDGDPIYSVCNRDTDIQEIIDAICN